MKRRRRKTFAEKGFIEIEGELEGGLELFNEAHIEPGGFQKEALIH